MKAVSEEASSLQPPVTKGNGGASTFNTSMLRFAAPAGQQGMGQTGRHRLF